MIVRIHVEEQAYVKVWLAIDHSLGHFCFRGRKFSRSVHKSLNIMYSLSLDCVFSNISSLDSPLTHMNSKSGKNLMRLGIDIAQSLSPLNVTDHLSDLVAKFCEVPFDFLPVFLVYILEWSIEYFL